MEEVLAAVAAATVAVGRAVAAREVVEAVRILRGTEKHQVDVDKRAVAKELNRLFTRGRLASPGKRGRLRFYAPVDKREYPLPKKESRRQQSLRLVQEACRRAGRPVRMKEIRAFAEETGITADLVARDVANLTRTGDLQIAAEVLGDGRGSKFYKPAAMDHALLAPKGPHTWMGEVWAVCQRVWKARESSAAAAIGRKPRPFATGEIRVALKASHPDHPKLEDPQLLVNALKALATRGNPKLTVIRRPGYRALLWAPAGWDQADLDLGRAFATDPERAAEAVRRAEERAGRPVSMREASDELDFDPGLRPGDGRSFKLVLHDTVRTRLAGEGGVRVLRQNQVVHRIGKLAGEVFYSTDRCERGKAWLQVERLRRRIEKRGDGLELEKIQEVYDPSVAIGRLLLVKERLSLASSHVRGVLERDLLDLYWTQTAQGVGIELDELLEAVDRDLAAFNSESHGLPERVAQEIPGWTASDVAERLEQVYPAMARMERDTELVTYLKRFVRRTGNPSYRRRSHSDPRAAAERLFDPTSVLILATRRWGGCESGHLCSLAAATLGPLRDPRFLLPSLESTDFNRRMSAVAGLAFLASPEATKALKKVAKSDVDPSIREAALHGLGFELTGSQRAFLRSRAKDDPDESVRDWAERLQGAEFADVLRM